MDNHYKCILLVFATNGAEIDDENGRRARMLRAEGGASDAGS